jgi:hypothetical protein
MGWLGCHRLNLELHVRWAAGPLSNGEQIFPAFIVAFVISR